MAPSPIDQALGTSSEILGPVSFDSSSCALELLAGLTDLNLALKKLNNDVFFNSKRWERRMRPPKYLDLSMRQFKCGNGSSNLMRLQPSNELRPFFSPIL